MSHNTSYCLIEVITKTSLTVFHNYLIVSHLMEELFEDTKGVIRIHMHNGQKKKYKRTNNDLQNIHIKLKIK
jgi:hypothetical protein